MTFMTSVHGPEFVCRSTCGVNSESDDSKVLVLDDKRRALQSADLPAMYWAKSHDSDYLKGLVIAFLSNYMLSKIEPVVHERLKQKVITPFYRYDHSRSNLSRPFSGAASASKCRRGSGARLDRAHPCTVSASECRQAYGVRFNRPRPGKQLLVGRTQDRAQCRRDLRSSKCRECPDTREDVSSRVPEHEDSRDQ
jgi:hypothetical protein